MATTTDVETKADDNQKDWFSTLRSKFEGTNYQVHILTPAYGGQVFVNYVLCLLETTQLLNTLGVKVKIDMLRNESLINRARNNLTARALSDPDMTHILWIDADITWSPIDVVKLLLSGHDMVAGSYVKKRIFWERLEPDTFAEIREMWNPDCGIEWKTFLQHHLVDYNCNFLSSTNEVTNNCMEVRHTATGFLMLTRQWHDKMIESYGESCKYTDDTGLLTADQQKWAYALYDTPIVDSQLLSEDWSVCDKWRRLGGKVYVDVTISLNHSGTYDFIGRLQSKLSFT